MKVPEYKNVTFLVRPQRVVTLIRSDDNMYWQHTAIRLIECYSEVWGGAYNLIIPTDGSTIREEFWAILETYDPDYLYLYPSRLLDLKSADPERYKQIIDIKESVLREQCPNMNGSNRKESIEREDEFTLISNPEINSCLKRELEERLSPFQFGGRVVERYFSADVWPLTKTGDIIQYTDEKEIACFGSESYSKDPSLMLLFHSHTGKAGEGYLDTLESLGIKRQQVTSLSQYFLIDPMGRGDLLPTPFSLSMVNLSRYRKKKEYREREEPIVLVLGDTIEDFCFFYCLSRMHRDFYWLPISFLSGHTEAKKKGEDRPSFLFQPELVPSRVMNLLYREIRRGSLQRDIVLTSISLAMDELEERKRELPEPSFSFEPELLGRIRVSKDLCNFADFPWRVFEQGNYLNQQTIVFLDGESVGRLETPKPKNFSLIDPKVHRWITEVMVDGYRLPQLHSLGPETLSLLLDEEGVRVSSEGLSYLCPNSIGYFGRDIDAELVKPKLKLVDPMGIFRSYFREAGYGYIELSDKGRYAQETTRKFGSLDEAGRFFSERTNLNLFDKFLTKKSVCDQETGEVVCIKDRAYLDFRAIGSALGSDPEAISLIDDFVSQGILYRGYIFQCTRCLDSDWYGVDEITYTFICKRCGAQRQYRHENWKSPEEPKWYYRLDEVVFQGYSNDMHVPLLTLFRLKSDSKSFLYVHELNLRKVESREKPDIEIDICCIPDGEIVIGESKAKKIPKEDVSKYSSFVSELPKYPDKVVFSTLEQNLSPDIGDRISSVRNSVLLLQGDLMSD